MKAECFSRKLSDQPGRIRGPLGKWKFENRDLVQHLEEAVDLWISGGLPQFSSPSALLKGMAAVDGRFSSIERCQFTSYTKARECPKKLSVSRKLAASRKA